MIRSDTLLKWFVPVPAGTTLMGDDDQTWLSKSFGNWRAEITNPFKLLRTPVTQGIWDEVLGGSRALLDARALGSDADAYSKRMVTLGKDHPMTCVSYDEAVEFCVAASKKLKKSINLATEAEWEHACRCGTTSKYYWGEDAADFAAHAWTRDSFSGSEKIRLHPVGQKSPNKWGLYDMIGLVDEWVRGAYPVAANGPYVDEAVYPIGGKRKDFSPPTNGDGRMVRGSSVLMSADCGTPGTKALRARTTRVAEIGFRVAMYD